MSDIVDKWNEQGNLNATGGGGEGGRTRDLRLSKQVVLTTA